MVHMRIWVAMAALVAHRRALPEGCDLRADRACTEVVRCIWFGSKVQLPGCAVAVHVKALQSRC